MTRIYRYILDTDCGMAPCVDDGMISLATCKPGIRKMARGGDWVAGFMPGTHTRGALVWAGRVEQALSFGRYQRTFPNRIDSVYKLVDDGQYQRLKPGYHCDPAQMDRDVDNPVLLFEKVSSWYFGAAPRSLPDRLMHLAAEGRGYRVNFREPDDLALWEAWLVGHEPGKRAEPRHDLVLCAGCQFCGGSNAPKGCGSRAKFKTEKLKRCYPTHSATCAAT